MYNEFKDKVVLVTGGNSGIGKATAFAFAKEGAKVIICGRDSEKGKSVVDESKKNGWDIDFIPTDVSIAEEVKNMIEQIIKKYGRMDIAFNNAGVDGDVARTAECSIENWNNVMSVNTNGTFYCMKYEIIEMLKTGGGSIVNNISLSGHRGYPGCIAYVTSKHSLVGLTQGAAMEYAGKQIRINGISPGLIKTPMTDKDASMRENYTEWVNNLEPLGRIGQPEEVSEAVLWLCSSKASFVTGHIMAVDGGILAR
ncbi:SDR family oxidoreductase [Clostridium tunisiense]|uniref:SDR family oxidoreductase n=1 Tax=Clostridium tunisiense TaxID=219748 RepID=UPI00031A1506|nr:SDR family oxidoreductase [Clostridium tunisiense]